MRVSQSQRQRTQDSPLVVGTFSQLSIRYLKGALGPKNQIVGRADTRFNSNGGFGGYQAILRDAGNGVYYGASESRKDGQAAGY